MTWEQLHPLTWELLSGSYRFLVQGHTARTWVAVMSGPGEHNTIFNCASLEEKSIAIAFKSSAGPTPTPIPTPTPVPTPTPTPGPTYKQWQLNLDQELNALYHGPGLSGPVNQWMLSNPIYPDPTP